MKAVFFTIAFVCFIYTIEGKKLNCNGGKIQVECQCFHRKKLKYQLDRAIDSLNVKIETTRLLKTQRQAMIHRFIRENGAQIGTVYRCKRRRYQALRDVFKAARQLRVVRALRVRCWRLLAFRWKLKRKCAKIKKYLRILGRNLRFCNRYQKYYLKTYKRAKLYSDTKLCKILAYRLRHVIWFQRHRKIQTQHKMTILKHKAYQLRNLSNRLHVRVASVCHTAKVLQARARRLRKTLQYARRKYRKAKQCTRKLKGTFRKIERRRFIMYLWLNKTRRYLRSLYRKRYRKVKLLCSVVEPKDSHCTRLNIKLYSNKRFNGMKYQ